MIGEQLEEVFIGSKIHLSATTIGLDDLSSTTIGGKEHSADLIFLDPFNKVAVAERACLRLRCSATTKESRCDHNDREH